MDNVPNEVKDVVESNLFPHGYAYVEPAAYSDLLLSIMKAIRARWNSTNSSVNSNRSRNLMNGSSANNYNSSSGNELDYSARAGGANAAQRQPINIQFRRFVATFCFISLQKSIKVCIGYLNLSTKR